jgi:hypothetical protein
VRAAELTQVFMVMPQVCHWPRRSVHHWCCALCSGAAGQVKWQPGFEWCGGPSPAFRHACPCKFGVQGLLTNRLGVRAVRRTNPVNPSGWLAALVRTYQVSPGTSAPVQPGPRRGWTAFLVAVHCLVSLFFCSAQLQAKGGSWLTRVLYLQIHSAECNGCHQSCMYLSSFFLLWGLTV